MIAFGRSVFVSSRKRAVSSTTHFGRQKYFGSSSASVSSKFADLLRAAGDDQELPPGIMKLAESSSSEFSRDQTVLMLFKLTKASKVHLANRSGFISHHWTAEHLDRICQKLLPPGETGAGELSADQLSMLMYSIQCLPMGVQTSPEIATLVARYITICSELLGATIADNNWFNRRLIAVSLSGLLHRSTATDPAAVGAVASIIKMLAVHIQRGTPSAAAVTEAVSAGAPSAPALAALSEHFFTPRSISNSIRGVGALYTLPEVQELLAVLSTRLAVERGLLKSHAGSLSSGVQDTLGEPEFHAFRWDQYTFSNTLYALKYFSSRDAAVRQFLTVLSELVASTSLVPTTSNHVVAGTGAGPRALVLIPPLTEKDVSFVCSGLQNMHSKHFAVREYVRVCVIPVLNGLHTFSGDGLNRHIATAMYGFRYMSSSHQQVLNMVHSFNRMIRRAEHASGQGQKLDPLSLSYADISSMVYGLQSLSSGASEVQTLMRQLAGIIAGTPPDKVVPSGVGFTPRLLAMCCFGLKNCSSDDGAARALISALLPHIEGFARRQATGAEGVALALTPRQISNIVYGARGLSSDNGVVRRYLRLMTAIIQTSGRISTVSCGAGTATRFNAQDVCNTLYGLQSMSSGCAETRWLLSAVMPHLQAHQPVAKGKGLALSAQGVSNCFYGLQRLSNYHSREVNQLLLTLAGLLAPVVRRERRLELTAQHVGNIMYGVQLMSCFSAWDPAAAVGVDPSNGGSKVYARGGSDPARRTAQDYSKVFREQICPIITQLLEGSVGPGTVLDGQELANCMFGLKSLSASSFLGAPLSRDGSTVRYNDASQLCNLLDAVSSVVERSSGLAGFGGGPASTAAASGAAAPAAPIILSAQEFAMVCYGLQGLYACPWEESEALQQLPPEALLRLRVQHDRVTGASRRLLRALLPSLSTCAEPVTYAELSMCCYGLVQCSSSFPEVRDLVNLLALRLQSFGLVASRGASAESREHRARPVYSSEGAVLRTSTRRYPYQISKLFRGLQNCSSEHAEVRRLLTLLTPLLKVDESEETAQLPAACPPAGGEIQRRRPSGTGNAAPPSAMVVLLHDEQAWKESLRRGSQGHAGTSGTDGFSLNLPQVLTGLRNMSHEHDEVRALLEQLAQHVDHSAA